MQGLSLVELMVALTIGLIILAAVSSLFVSSKQTYTTQDHLARLQENARFAMQFLIKDLRLGGYVGCLDEVDANSLGTTLNGGFTFTTNALVPIEGVENATGTWKPSGTARPATMKAGTDAFVVRLADPGVAANVAPGMLNGSANLDVDNATPFKTGDIIVVSDCAGADITQITDITGNTLQHATSGQIPGNSTLDLGKAYEPPARVFKINSRQYFVQNNPSGIPALYRQDGGTAAVELVEGVEDMQVLYGEYTANPPDPKKSKWTPSIYRKASDVVNWSKVLSIRIGILVRTLDNKNQDLDTGTYDVDGDGTAELTNPNDRFRRRVFQAVVQLRNMQ